MINERIESVRREKRLAENLKSRGIGALAGKVNFSVNSSDGPSMQYSKWVRAIRRQLKASTQFTFENFVEQLDEILGHGPYRLSIEPITSGDDEYVTRLLYACIKRKCQQNVYKENPVKVIWQRGCETVIGYSFLSEEIPPKYHNHTLRGSTSKADTTRKVDGNLLVI